MGHTSSEIHSNRSLGQRKEALEGFKIGRYKVLVATDIAARGIDVTGIELVLNYDLPENPEDYVHRIGRTGRAGLSGKAVSFATPDQRYDVRSIERLIKMTLPITQSPELAAVSFSQGEPSRDFSPQRSRPNSYNSPRPDRNRNSRGGYAPRTGSFSDSPSRSSAGSSSFGKKSRSRYKDNRNFSKPNPNRPQDQGFDANHRKPTRPYDPNRISYRNDRDSY
jgi:ATP-dependent RNA helicase RhlE